MVDENIPRSDYLFRQELALMEGKTKTVHEDIQEKIAKGIEEHGSLNAYFSHIYNHE